MHLPSAASIATTASLFATLTSARFMKARQVAVDPANNDGTVPVQMASVSTAYGSCVAYLYKGAQSDGNECYSASYTCQNLIGGGTAADVQLFSGPGDWTYSFGYKPSIFSSPYGPAYDFRNDNNWQCNSYADVQVAISINPEAFG